MTPMNTMTFAQTVQNSDRLSKIAPGVTETTVTHKMLIEAILILQERVEKLETLASQHLPG